MSPSLDGLLIAVSEAVGMESILEAFHCRVRVSETAEAHIWAAAASFSTLQEGFSGSSLGMLPLYC